MSITRTLATKPWILSLMIGMAVAAWLFSGMIGREIDDIPDPSAGSVAGPSGFTEALPVQVRTQEAELVGRVITVFGRTAPVRRVELKSETDGRVEHIALARGDQARGGTLLLRLDLRDRAARLEQARAEVRQHEAAYRGQLELQADGYISPTQLAETLAKLESARAELLRAELDLANREVRAPFNGVLLERVVEIGDFVRAGDTIATWVDNTSIIVTGSVTERDAVELAAGAPAMARLITGQEARGRLRYVSPVADEATRTFQVELEIPNPDGKLPAGVTADMRIPVGERLAHRLSPSLLTLAADGKLGVKTMDADNQVVFHEIEIVRSEAAQVWVSGLPETANVIVVGQGYAAVGQLVAPSWLEPETALAERAP
jgi:multidrug efflux system membrane fusion protein